MSNLTVHAKNLGHHFMFEWQICFQFEIVSCWTPLATENVDKTRRCQSILKTFQPIFRFVIFKNILVIVINSLENGISECGY